MEGSFKVSNLGLHYYGQGEDGRFQALHNRQLLWHGSRISKFEFFVVLQPRNPFFKLNLGVHTAGWVF